LIRARGCCSLILFSGSFAHFHAISWIYREDYARAGIQMRRWWELAMAPDVSADIIITAGMLVGVSVLPSVLGLAGVLYFFGALVLSTALVQVLFVGRGGKIQHPREVADACHDYSYSGAAGLMMYDKIAR